MIWIKLGGLRLGLNWKDYDKGLIGRIMIKD